MPEPDIFLRSIPHAAELVLNRPAKRNALTLAMWAAIPGLAQQTARDPRVRALIVRGSGGVFSAGADIGEFQTAYRTSEDARANHRILQDAMGAIEAFPKPSVALIEGACVGGGCGLALACDLRFASETAHFAITPAKLGLVYGAGDTRRLIQAVGRARAKQILFTGQTIDAATALAWGLVGDVSPAPETAVADFVAALAQAAPSSQRAVKEIIARLDTGLQEDDDASTALFAQAYSGADFAEGLAAFQQKRPPRFPQD